MFLSHIPDPLCIKHELREIVSWLYYIVDHSPQPPLHTRQRMACMQYAMSFCLNAELKLCKVVPLNNW